MRLAVLTSLIVAGSASFVAASPDRDESTRRVTLSETAKPQLRRDGDWIEIATPTPVRHGKEYITLRDDTGTISRLRIDSHAGRPYVYTVRINFTNGTSRIARIERAIDKKRPVYVDLKGAKEIESLVVVTDPDSRAEYRVMGLPAAAGVARR